MERDTHEQGKLLLSIKPTICIVHVWLIVRAIAKKYFLIVTRCWVNITLCFLDPKSTCIFEKEGEDRKDVLLTFSCWFFSYFCFLCWYLVMWCMHTNWDNDKVCFSNDKSVFLHFSEKKPVSYVFLLASSCLYRSQMRLSWNFVCVINTYKDAFIQAN